jgi:hypothetical protein
MIKLNYYKKKYDNITEGFSKRKKRKKRKKKKKEKKKLANELGLSVKDYSQELKDGSPKPINKKRKKERIINEYSWPDYKYPLENRSIVQMNRKPSKDLKRNIPYLYKNPDKNKFCVKLDKCKEIEIKNDFLKKKLLKTEIKLGYLKLINDKKITEIDDNDKEFKKKSVGRGITILILIIFVGTLIIARYYLSVLRKIKIFN